MINVGFLRTGWAAPLLVVSKSLRDRPEEQLRLYTELGVARP